MANLGFGVAPKDVILAVIAEIGVPAASAMSSNTGVSFAAMNMEAA